MNGTKLTTDDIAEQLAVVASSLQAKRTGHAPKAVTVVLSEDTLVVTLHEALTPAERELARSPQGAAQVQEFHRQLFANSTEEMRREIQRITGRHVREAIAEIETETGTVVHAFTTGAMVQVFLLTPDSPSNVNLEGGAQVEEGADRDGDTELDIETEEQVERAEDDGLRITPDPGLSE
ncbi:MAG: Na-translocating system protein MpsC family protein [Pirellulaceae bacterium]